MDCDFLFEMINCVFGKEISVEDENYSDVESVSEIYKSNMLIEINLELTGSNFELLEFNF